MMDAALLELICCPETRQELRPAETALVAKLNQQVEAGTLRNRAGQLVKEKLQGGLVRADGLVLYPVRTVPILLLEEAISLTK
jgi:uncharacterized protein YbaR (Trm112 family)